MAEGDIYLVTTNEYDTMHVDDADGYLKGTRQDGTVKVFGMVRGDVTPAAEAARDQAVAAAENAVATLPGLAVDAVDIAVGGAVALRNLSYSLVWGTQVNSEVIGTVSTGSGAPAFTSSGKFGTCLSGGTVVAGSSASVPEPAAGESITVEGWVKAAAAPTGASRRVAFSISGQAMYLAAEATTGYASVTLDNNRRWISASNICDGAWHHVAVVLTRSANLTTCTGFWVDGVAAANAPSGSPVAAAWSPAGVRIGGIPVSTAFDWQGPGTAGTLDEVRVTSGTRYLEAFTPQTAAFAWDSRTLLLAHLDSTAYSEAATIEGYPARPVGALGGSVTYIGPSQPTDWVKNDQWTEVTA